MTLEVTDNVGAKAEASAVITVSDPPPPVVSGTVGYTTLNAAGGIPLTYAWSIADPGSPQGPGSAAELAVPFVMQAGGSLHSVDLPFTRKSFAASSTTTRTISLAVDAGGFPGTVLESWTFVPGQTMSLVKLSSAKRPTLKAGIKYWLTAHINPTGTGIEGWPSNELGINGPMLYRRSTTEAFVGFTSVLPAFRVNLGGSVVVPVNQPPVARIAASPVSGVAPLAVTFSGSGSSDPDGNIAAYGWSLDDGSTSSGVTAKHTFADAGTYRVTLKVTDDDGAKAEASVVITVSDPPPPVVSATVGYTTLNAAGGIPLTYAWSIADPGSAQGASSAAELAAAFVMQAGGSLQSVDLPIARKSYAATSKTPRTISLAADAGDRPGTVLESWTFVPGQVMTMVKLSSVKHPAMKAGAKYWLTAHINPTGTGIESWPSNELGINGPLLYRRSLTQALTPFTSILPAFRVNVTARAVGPSAQDFPPDYPELPFYDEAGDEPILFDDSGEGFSPDSESPGPAPALEPLNVTGPGHTHD